MGIMEYDERVFDVLDTMVTENDRGIGIIDASSYGEAADESYGLFEEMCEDDLVIAVDEDHYLITDDGRRYHSELLQEDVLDALAEDEPLSAAEITSALGYDGCEDHTVGQIHDCAINAVRRSLKELHGSQVGSTPEWTYKLSSSERERRL